MNRRCLLWSFLGNYTCAREKDPVLGTFDSGGIFEPDELTFGYNMRCIEVLPIAFRQFVREKTLILCSLR